MYPIKDTEQLLSGEALIAFRNLPPSGKREVVKEILRNTVAEAIDAEIIDYFKQINAADTEV